jgi:hypothetical protein
VRKDEILGLDWDIVPTDEASRDMRNNPSAHGEFQDRRAEALEFFKRPDPNYHDFSSWLSAVLEDVFVVDALSLYIHPPRIPGKGIFGSNLSALEVLDGTTIRPMLDIRGGTPRPPEVAFQQYLYGIPRVDLMDIILQADIEEMDEPVDEFTGDQILYLPQTRRSWTPYGFPGIERAIIPVMTGLRRQQFQLDFFSEGTIPGQFVIPGDDISTPQQIRQLQDTLNALAGDQAWKHKIIVLPRGSDTKPQKNVELADAFDQLNAEMVCMAYSVMPMEVGMTSSRNSASMANDTAKESAAINQRKALKPMLKWLKTSIFDHVLQDICQQDDMQFVWIGLEDTDEEAQANNYKTLASFGAMSIDEVRTALGMNPWGLPLTSDPTYQSATGISSLGLIAPAVADSDLGDPVVDPSATGTDPTGTATAVTLPGQSPEGANQAPVVTTATPVSATGTPGVGGRPSGGGGGAPVIVAPAAAGSTPLHSSSGRKKQSKMLEVAANQEFDRMRRTLKKGRSLKNWSSEFVPQDVVRQVSHTFDLTKNESLAIAAGKRLFKNAQRVSQRAETLFGISSDATNALASLAQTMNDPKVGMIGFIDHGTQVLQQGYHAAFNAAAQDAVTVNPRITPVGQQDFRLLAQTRAEQQRGFLTGFAQDLQSGVSPAQLRNRLNLYGRSLVPAYEQGYGLTVLSSPTRAAQGPGPSIDSSELSDYNALNEAYMTSAPDSGQPSDGMLALASLAALVGTGLVAADLIGANNLGANTDPNAQPDDEAQPTPIIWRCSSDHACDLCSARDGQEYSLETLPCWPGDGGFGEFCEGAANCECTLEYGDLTADNPFSDLTNEFYPQRLAEENQLDQQATDARAADIADVALDSPGAADRMAARDTENGTPYTRYGTGGRLHAGATPDLVKDASDIEDIVYGYLAKQYTPDALEWVKNATWSYDPAVDVSSLVLARPTLETNHEKVEAIKDKISSGESIKPIVVVKTMQGNEVVDGNHRVNALKQLGVQTVAAYVGEGDEHLGQYAVMMQHEKVQKTMYKSFDAGVLSQLQIGDIVFDEKPTVFSSTRPDAVTVAIVKNLPGGIVHPGQELIVTSIDDNEVTLEIL